MNVSPKSVYIHFLLSLIQCFCFFTASLAKKLVAYQNSYKTEINAISPV